MTDAPKRLQDVVSETEFTDLLTRCRAAAEAQGRYFIFDEYGQLVGERTQAAYIRQLADSVGMAELAARLDPAQFAPSDMEQVIEATAKVGRRSFD